jgi:hypothetical protein
MPKLAAALAVVALLSGCAGAHSMAAATPVSDIVPWLPLPPDLTPLPEPSPRSVPVPTGTPMCSVADLEAAVIGSNGAGGRVLTVFAFASRGQVACVLDGTPSVTLFDASGRQLPFSNQAPFFPNQVSGPALVEPGPLPVLGEGLKSGEAGLTIDWDSQPEACPQTAPTSVARARITVSNGDTVTIDVPQEPAGYACQGVGVGNFADLPLPDNSSPLPPAPQPTIMAPTSAKAGSQLHYVVSLANQTKLPIDLGSECFNYDEELLVAIAQGTPKLDKKNLYQLNCAAAGVLDPGHPKKFAMVLGVPADTVSGSYTLVFNIGEGSAMTKVAHAVVTIV